MTLPSPPRLPFQALLLLGVVFLLFGNTLRHGYNLDDSFITGQLPETASGWAGVKSVFGKVYDEADYRPLGVFTFALEQWISGSADPGTSHLLNVLFFWLCTLMVLFCIRQFPTPDAPWLALITALIFAAHPIHANVVSSLKNRDILLSFMLGASALWCVLYSLRSAPARPAARLAFRTGFFILASALFLLGSLAKQDVISFAFLIAVAYFLFAGWQRGIWRYARYLLLLAVPFALYRLFVAFRYEYIARDVLNIQPVENTVFLTENPLILDPSPLSKVGVALTSVFYYLKFHLVPSGYYYYFGYDMVPTGNLWHPYNLVAAAALLAGAWAFFRFMKSRPEISFAVAAFFLALLYALNLYMPVAGIVAPRLGFTASAGFSLGLAVAVLEMARRLAVRRKSLSFKQAIWGLTGLAVLIYAPFTISRNADWKDLPTLIAADIPHLNRSFEAQRIAAATYFNMADTASNPSDRQLNMERAYRHAKLGSAVYDGDIYVEETLGLTAYMLGRDQEAFDQMRSVTEKFPESEAAWQVLGDLHARRGEHLRAAEFFEKLGLSRPEQPFAFIHLTENLVAAGQGERALEFNREQIDLAPDKYYHYEGCAFVYLNRGDTLAAAAYLVRALDANSPNTQYIGFLESYYNRNGLEEEWQRILEGWRPEMP